MMDWACKKIFAERYEGEGLNKHGKPQLIEFKSICSVLLAFCIIAQAFNP